MCKLKVNEKKELKAAKLAGGQLRPSYLAIIQDDAARARMKVFDYLVNCAVYLHANKVIPVKEECFSDNDNRQTFIKRKIDEYIGNRAEYRTINDLRNKLYDQLAASSVDYTDSFHSTCINGEVDELHYNLSAVEASLRDYNVNGEGLLQDISHLLSDRITWPLEEAGEDTCFLLMCPAGTLAIPLKIVNGRIWMGSLPPKSVVYINGNKKVM